ncbi:MAG: glycosyltransferase family 2 protein [Thermoleophilia bacterium]|nr:glycosyltransferase family 2 protein [Thermoleophilia bacterium]
MTALSVVLINGGRDGDLESCSRLLARQAAQERPELVVVTTPTSPDVRRRIEAAAPGVRWIEVDRFGVGLMRNRGLAAAGGEIVLFLDTDTRVQPGALDALVGAFSRYPRLGAAGGKLVGPDGTLQFSARRFYTLASLVLRRIPGERARNSRAVRSHLLAEWDHDDERVVDWIVGACFAMRRRAADEVGGFSEDSAFGFEDVDWCHRAAVAGWEVRYVPSAVVVHEWVRSSFGLNTRTLMHVYAAGRFYLRARSRSRSARPPAAPRRLAPSR